MAQLLALPPTPTQFAAAQRTLGALNHYAPNRFSLHGASQGLGRQGKSEMLRCELWILIAHGFATQDRDSIYELTPKGRQYEPLSTDAYDDSPVMISTPSPAPVQERAPAPSCQC